MLVHRNSPPICSRSDLPSHSDFVLTFALSTSKHNR